MDYSPYSHRSHPDYPRPLVRRPSLPIWVIVLLGAVLARLTAWIDAETLSWSAGVLSMVAVSVWCGLHFPQPHRWFVAAGTLLTMLLLLLVVRSYNLTWMLIGTLIASVLVYGYGYLSTWFVRPREASAASATATALPVSRRAALVIPLLIQLVLLIVTWSYMQRPGTALDLVRRVQGIRRIQAFPAATNVLSLSPDGTRAVVLLLDAAPIDYETATSESFPVSVVDVRTGAVIQTLDQRLQWLSSEDQVAISRDGNRVAIDNGADIRVWQVDDGKLIAQLPPGAGSGEGMQFSPDASLLAVIGDEKEAVQLWSLRDGSLVHTLGADAPSPHYQDIVFTPDGQQLALRDGDTVTIWRVADGTLQRTLESTRMLASSFPPSLAFSPDGQLLVVSGLEYGQPTVAELWRVGDGVLLHTLRDDQTDAAESAWDSAVAFSADGARLMTTTRRTTDDGYTHMALIWDVQDGRLLRRIDSTPGVGGLRYATNEGEFLVSRGPDIFALPAD